MPAVMAPPAPARFEQAAVIRPPGLVRRLLTTLRHFGGLAAGGLAAWTRSRREARGGRGLRFLLASAVALATAPFVDRSLRRQPFAVQLRRRLEMLGPTYIKLGQILSLREDILPLSITSELKQLLSRLPAVPFSAIRAIVERDLGADPAELFLDIDEVPLGSASIGQTHRATTRHGGDVVIKVIKPGIRDLLKVDAKLLRALGAVLQLVLPRYQPRRLINEFVTYTLREIDLGLEADNAETFAANFRDMPGVHFPEIVRELSAGDVLTMEFLDGLTPDSPEALALPAEARSRLVDLGAASIIRMLYQDGFFHADLHPANLLILPGPSVGFIDVGMVGRLDDELRRTMLYYFFALVSGDAESAARYLAAAAQAGSGGDPAGFRREVADISRRWSRLATFEHYSLGQLILDSVQRGARFNMYFPVELVLMVKALVTFEGVGHVLLPGFDVAAVSRRHVRRIVVSQFSPLRLLQEGVRGAPDALEAFVKMPLLMSEGLRVLEKTARRHPENPLAGVRGSIAGGFCLVSGAIVLSMRGPLAVGVLLFAAGVLLSFRRGA